MSNNVNGMRERRTGERLTQDAWTEQSSSGSPRQEEVNSTAVVIHPASHSGSWWSRFRVPILGAGFAFLLAPITFASSWLSPAALQPTDYAGRTKRLLSEYPLIDGHNDLPWQLRLELHNRIYDADAPDLESRLLGHTDLVRMREGQVGGQFWSVYVHCDVNQKHHQDPSWVTRDTLEQIDVTRRFINEHPRHLEYCDTPACVRKVFKAGRIASMIGIEGGHQVGGSVSALRQFYELGARYMTLTHNCDNTFATSASTIAAGGEEHGLLPLGFEAVKEMNRLGMMVDLSHVSHQTMRDVLSVARAPVIFSHSGAFSVHPHLRHVPDDVLRTVKANGGIVMAVFVNRFLNMKDPMAATIHDVVDHIYRIAEVCGWECVGIGSDFSGTPHVPIGLEDVSKFPDLIELVMARGATDEQVKLLVGENLLRVWENIERRAAEIQATGEKPVEAEYEAREWHLGLQNSPWMRRESRDKSVAQGKVEYHMFNVDKEGRHNPAVKGV